MRRVMAVGPSGSGKTTLLKRLGLWDGDVKKTEGVLFSCRCIDTPGEFISVPRFYGALIFSSFKADVVLFVVSVVDPVSFPRGFARSLRGLKLGAINKVDLLVGVRNGGLMEKAKMCLWEAGVMEVFAVSAMTGEGVDLLGSRLRGLLDEDDGGGVLA